jgi:hypothetical protein
MANKGTCKASDCNQDVHGKGYCARHYRQWRKGTLPKPRYRSCNAEGCHKPRSRRGLCQEHFAKEYGKSKAQAGEGAAAASPATA